MIACFQRASYWCAGSVTAMAVIIGHIGLVNGSPPGIEHLTPAEQGRQHKATQISYLAWQFLDTRARQSVSDTEFLEASLSLLHSSHSEGILWERKQRDVLGLLVDRRWRYLPDGSLGNTLSRLTRGFIESDRRWRRRDGLSEAEKMAREYTELTGKPWPFDWRSRRAFWLGLVETIIRSKAADDPAGLWRQRIAADPTNAELYRRAYVRVARHHDAKKSDSALVKPLIDAISNDPRQEMARMADLLPVLPFDCPERATLFQRLLQRVAERKVKPEVLAHFHREMRSEEEGTRLLEKILFHYDAGPVAIFADVANVPSEVVREWFLAKRVGVGHPAGLVGEKIDELARKVVLPLWIDRSVDADPTILDFTAQGPWLEVVEAVLRPTKHRAVFLQPDLIWIGPPSRRARAEKMINHGLAQISDEHPRLADALREPTDLQLPPDTPLTDVVEYLAPYHGVEIVLLEDGFNPPITMDLRDLPLHLALTILTDDIDLDWCIFGPTILLGKKPRIAALRKSLPEKRRRWLGVRIAEGRVAEALRSPTEMGLPPDTPVADYRELLSLYHGIPVEVSDRLHDVLVTLDLRGIDLFWALEVMSLKLGVSWRYDSERIYIEDTKSR